ncbi:hypothetical protein DFH09DRAFT_1451001 [Mycena vulgaris]|nr:hypothetical protein DFH09DRAFT_1451001 [Mycena vulgaris]
MAVTFHVSDPNTFMVLICGYPNVGKSSFINKLTRADVDAQPYAFTLFVGHLDCAGGSLTRPSCVLYFMDLNGSAAISSPPTPSSSTRSNCSSTTSRPQRLDLPAETRALVQEIINTEGIKYAQTQACDALLAHRVEAKVKGSKITSVTNRMHFAQPKPRERLRAPCIPRVVKERKKYAKNDPERRRLARDVERGVGVYNIDLKENYLCTPEPRDIMHELLEALEREEEKLEADGFYESEEDMEESEDECKRIEARTALSRTSRGSRGDALADDHAVHQSGGRPQPYHRPRRRPLAAPAPHPDPLLRHPPPSPSPSPSLPAPTPSLISTPPPPPPPPGGREEEAFRAREEAIRKQREARAERLRQLEREEEEAARAEEERFQARKRDDEGADMEAGETDTEVGGEGEDGTSAKRLKTASGAVGMRGQGAVAAESRNMRATAGGGHAMVRIQSAFFAAFWC